VEVRDDEADELPSWSSRTWPDERLARMLRREKRENVDVARDATELIVLEGFRPRGSRMIERGERFSRDLDLAKTYPEYFGLLLPLSQLQEVNHGEQKAGAHSSGR
jgi:hypothetical protein